jgi:hypothetical protein
LLPSLALLPDCGVRGVPPVKVLWAEGTLLVVWAFEAGAYFDFVKNGCKWKIRALAK